MTGRKGNLRERLVDADAERAIAGLAVVSWGQVAGLDVDAGDFYIERYRRVFEAVRRIAAEGDVPDPNLVATEAGDGVTLADVVEIAADAPATGRLYAERIKDLAKRRRALAAAEAIARAAADPEADPLATAVEQAARLAEAGRDGRDQSPAAEAYDLLTRYQDGAGMRVGIGPLDQALGGVEPGLYLLAARTSMGKTAVAIQIAVNVASRGERVLFYSQEMTPGQIFARAACMLAEVPLDRARRNACTGDEWAAILRELGELELVPLEIRRARSAEDVRMQLRAAEDVRLAVVDGMWLLQTPKLGNRNLELGWTSQNLKLASLEADVPVLAVHQLSRATETRQEKRPMLSDLRESGRLEEDADVVMFLYRENYYDPQADPTMEVWIAKNRLGGPSGRVVRLRWNGPLMRVEPLAEPAPLGFD